MRDKTVEEAFLEDLAAMIPLAQDDFPPEERTTVCVGKTPYLRFDKNDYSVPHTHLQRSLTVVVTDQTVRILDPEAAQEVLAEHPRSFERAMARERYGDRARGAHAPEPRPSQSLIGPNGVGKAMISRNLAHRVA